MQQLIEIFNKSSYISPRTDKQAADTWFDNIVRELAGSRMISTVAPTAKSGQIVTVKQFSNEMVSLRDIQILELFSSYPTTIRNIAASWNIDDFNLTLDQLQEVYTNSVYSTVDTGNNLIHMWFSMLFSRLNDGLLVGFDKHGRRITTDMVVGEIQSLMNTLGELNGALLSDTDEFMFVGDSAPVKAVVNSYNTAVTYPLQYEVGILNHSMHRLKKYNPTVGFNI